MTDAQPPPDNVVLAVYITANISGGHVNPAVTLAAMLTGHISIVKGLAFIIFQISGACLGTLMIVSLPQKTPATYPLQSHLQTMHPHVKCALSLSHQFTTYCRDRERDTTMLWLCSISKRKILQTHIACINAFKYKDILLPDAAGWTCAWVLCGYG